MMLEWWSWDTFESSVGSRAEASFTVTILKIQHPTFLWTCFPPTSCPLKPCSNPLLHLSLQNRKGKFLQGQCEPSQWLLQPHSRAHPAAAEHRTLQGSAHCMAPSDPALRWSETENDSSTSLFFSLLKTGVAKYSAGEVMIVEQYLPDGKPLKYLPFFMEKIILRNCPWAVSLDL